MWPVPSPCALLSLLLVQLLFIAAVTPIMHDFYNYDPSSPEFLQEFVQFLKACWPRPISTLLYCAACCWSRAVFPGTLSVGSARWFSLRARRGDCCGCGPAFGVQNLALFGALLFYLGMRSSAAKLARKRKATCHEDEVHLK